MRLNRRTSNLAEPGNDVIKLNASQFAIWRHKLACLSLKNVATPSPENTKGGSITVPLTSCLTGLDLSVLQIKTKIVSSHTADSKPVKQEANCTVMLPPLVFPA